MSGQSTTHQVRQILMNELGLTRESIRAEMEKIVADTIAKRIGNMNIDWHIDGAIARELKKWSSDTDAFKRLVTEKVTEEVVKKIRDGMKLSITVQQS